MRISIISPHNVFHPGAVLQAYALRQVLCSMGHNVEFVNYLPARNGRKSLRFIAGGLLRSLRGEWGRNREYRSFLSCYCPSTSLEYRTLADLRNEPPEADAYICGSDQIWNPSLTGGDVDPAYFLDFGPESIKKIAYAPSFGGAALSHLQKQRVAGYLEKIDRISIREQSGKDLILNITGKDVPVLLDPALLLENGSSICEPPKKCNGYILLYQLNPLSGVDKIASELSARQKKPVLHIDAPVRMRPRTGRSVSPSSPKEWIGLINSAQSVVTDSFHGVAFSVLFQRPFLCVDLSSKSGRLFDLCRRLGLENRCFDGNGYNLDRAGGDIDWSRLDRVLKNLRAESLGFLKESLGSGSWHE